MKVENVTPKPSKKFQPITFTVTIESEKELQEMWHRLNVSPSRLKYAYPTSTKPHAFDFDTSTACYALWSLLDEAMAA